MQTVIRLFIFLALSASISTAMLPLQSAMPQAEKSSCCANMKMDDHQQDDCGKQMPKSRQDQQCCAACSIGLVASIDRPTLLLPPPPTDESFAAYTFDLHSRSEPPPVPPPRLLAA
jgi:hypothetical protein